MPRRNARRSVREPFCNFVRRFARRFAFAAAGLPARWRRSPSHAAAKIQHLISPGGIEAWFVQDATVPLIAMEYAFGGGADAGPGRQARRRQHGRQPARRGLRRSGFQDLPRAARPPRHRAQLQLDAGLFPRLAAHAQGQHGRSLRPAADGADLAAFREHRCRAHSRPGHFGPAARHLQSLGAGQPQVPAKSPLAIIPMAARPTARWKAFRRSMSPT